MSETGALFLDIDDEVVSVEDPRYLSKQLITYIGNKRSFTKHLELAIWKARDRSGGRQLKAVDLFSGSGFAARLLKRHSSLVVANDLEPYSAVINRCFLTNREDVDWDTLANLVDSLNKHADAGSSSGGFFEELYAPEDDNDIQLGERAFYTRDNARRLDFFAEALADLAEPFKTLLMGPLLSSASIHANTSGVFKGFYKDKETGLGKFGGYAGDALKRILEPIRLELPVLSVYSTASRVHIEDANSLITDLEDLDLAYLDPPYNQHPYGSNYFMLNLLVDYQRPDEISRVSGIPVNWKRSGFNVRRQSFELLADLVERTPARFLLVSFNAEGFVDTKDLGAELAAHGRVDEIVIPYTTFRGSRNLKERSISVNEHLFLLERS